MAGTVIKLDAAPIRPPSRGVVIPQEVVFCPCDFRCDFEERVFASDENDGIENDFSEFLFKKIAASDTIEIQIVREGVILAVVSDDTYGMYYDGFDAQPLYVGWVADWTKIFNQFSGGRYQIRVLTNILGEDEEFLSRYFRLNTFDIISANKTVKVETVQTGRFENGEFDFTDLLPDGWRTSIRLSGTFGQMQPNLERDIYQDPSYREVQNRDQVTREYKLRANLVPESIQNRIAVQDMLANQVLITSYDVLQELTYEKYPVVPESFGDARYDGLGNTYFEITFSDRQKNIIKTNAS